MNFMSTHYRTLRRAIDKVNDAEDAVTNARNDLLVAEAELGLALKNCRQAKGLSLRQCAIKLKLSAPYLSDVERGRRSISTDNLECYMGIIRPPTIQDIFETITHNKITPTSDETKIR